MKPGGRRSVRCSTWDYTSPGAHYITLNTHRFQPIFARTVGRAKCLTVRGILATACWLAIPSHFAHVRLDEFTVMPTHFHGVLVLIEGPRWFALDPTWVEPEPREARLISGSIGAIVGSYKSAVTRLVHRVAPDETTRVAPVWQRGYHDRIIRDGREFDAKRRYTINNWDRWVDEHLR